MCLWMMFTAGGGHCPHVCLPWRSSLNCGDVAEGWGRPQPPEQGERAVNWMSVCVMHFLFKCANSEGVMLWTVLLAR